MVDIDQDDVLLHARALGVGLIVLALGFAGLVLFLEYTMVTLSVLFALVCCALAWLIGLGCLGEDVPF